MNELMAYIIELLILAANAAILAWLWLWKESRR